MQWSHGPCEATTDDRPQERRGFWDNCPIVYAMERMAGILNRLRESRSPIAFASLCVSIACATIVVAVPDARQISGLSMVPWQLHQFFGVAVGVLAIGVFASKYERLYRYLAAVQALIVLLHVGLFPTSFGVGIMLLIPTLFSWGLYERFPANTLIAGGLSVMVALVRSSTTGVGVLDTAAFALCGTSIGVSLSTLSLNRERSLSLERRLKALEVNVTELTRANLLIQDYAQEVQAAARESERLRLTRDIHDIVGYSFTNAMMMAEAAKFMALKEPSEVVTFLESLRSTIRDALKEVKGALREFRSSEQPPMPTNTTLYLLIQVFSISTGVNVRLEPGNTKWSGIAGFGHALYHFVQEGLINAFTHGHARNVTILLWDSGDEYQAQVLDDGRGALQGVNEGIGIGGMRERAQEVGGRIEIGPHGPGFTIKMILPKEEP